MTDAPHSAEWFGDVRDYWWNGDHLELIGARLGLRKARSVLDVGCGVGHWGRVLARIVAPDASVVGIDPEPEWVRTATLEAEHRGLAERFRYLQATVEALPFE